MSQFSTKRPQTGHAQIAWDYAHFKTGYQPNALFFADWLNCWLADYPPGHPGSGFAKGDFTFSNSDILSDAEFTEHMENENIGYTAFATLQRA